MLLLCLLSAQLVVSRRDGVGRRVVALQIQLALLHFANPFMTFGFEALFLQCFLTLKLLWLLLAIPDPVPHLDQTLFNYPLLRVGEPKSLGGWLRRLRVVHVVTLRV